MLAVPGANPLTRPAAVMLAIAAAPLLQAPVIPVVSDSDAEDSSQTDNGPAMTGSGFAVAMSVTKQPVAGSR
jgi:hypothetical protein